MGASRLLGTFLSLTVFHFVSAQSYRLFVNDIQTNPGQIFAVDLPSLTLSPAASTVGFFRLEGMTWNGSSIALYDEGQRTNGTLGRIWSLYDHGAPPTVVGQTNLGFAEGIAHHPVSGNYYTLHNVLGLTVINVVSPSGTWIDGGVLTLPPQANPFGNSSDSIREIAISPSGVLVASRALLFAGEIGSINPTTWTFIPITPTTGTAGALTFDPTNGDLLYVTDGADALYRYSFATSTTTLLGTLTLANNIGSVGLINAMCFAPISFSSAALQGVGMGCAGGSSPTPVLTTANSTLPVIGSPNFAFRVESAPPGALTMFFIANATQLSSILLGPGCDVHLEPTSLIEYLSLGINPFVATAADASGVASMPFSIPNNPLLNGGSFGVQALIIDPLAALGLSLTPALGVTYGI